MLANKAQWIKKMLLFKSFLKVGMMAVFLVTSISSGLGQEEARQAFLDAKIAFEEGKLNEVVERLEGWVEEKNLGRVLRREMLDILTETYLYQEQKTKADTVYLKRLRLDPFYEFDKNVPELKYLEEDFDIFPRITYRVFAGPYFFSLPRITQDFAPSGVTIVDETYERESGSWYIGGEASFGFFNFPFDISLGYVFSKNQFKYEGNYQLNVPAEPDGALLKSGMVTFSEQFNSSQIPLTLTYHFTPNKKKIIHTLVIPYLQFGGALELIHVSSAEMTQISGVFEGELFGQSGNFTRVNPSMIKLNERRKGLNFGLVASIGAKVRFKEFFVDVNVRYNYLINNLVNPDLRLDNVDMANRYYLDNDFSFHRLGASIGVGMFLFDAHKKPEGWRYRN